MLITHYRLFWIEEPPYISTLLPFSRLLLTNHVNHMGELSLTDPRTLLLRVTGNTSRQDILGFTVYYTTDYVHACVRYYEIRLLL